MCPNASTAKGREGNERMVEGDEDGLVKCISLQLTDQLSIQVE